MNQHLYKYALGLCLSLGLLPSGIEAQTTQQASTFGQIINLGYTPSDVVLDESRGMLYVVNTNANRVDIVSASTQKLVRSILVGTSQLAAVLLWFFVFLFVFFFGV